jgi:hypothetical protein
MSSIFQDDSQSIPAQRIDYVFKRLQVHFPNLYLPFWLALREIKYRFIRDLPSEIQFLEELLYDKSSKSIVDWMEEGEAQLDESDEWRKVVAFAEYMHSNKSDYVRRIRAIDLLISSSYGCDEVLPLVIYSGDEKCRLVPSDGRLINPYSYFLFNLTDLEPGILMEHPSFGIQFLTIFSHRLTKDELVAFFIPAFKQYRQTVTKEVFHHILALFYLSSTTHNAMAVREVIDHFFDDKSIEYIQAFLKDTPYYDKIIEYFEERTRKATERADAAEAARIQAQAQAKLAAEAEAKAKADRIAGAVRLVQDYGLTIVQIVQALGLTDDEIAAVESALKA